MLLLVRSLQFERDITSDDGGRPDRNHTVVQKDI